MSSTPAEGAVAALCDELYALGISNLPETVEVDETRLIMDGSHRYVIFYFEDGTTFTSEGYRADSYSALYRSVFDRLTAYGTLG